MVTGKSSRVDFGDIPSASVIVTKTVTPVVARVGDNVTYTITIKNTGTVGLEGIVVSDPLLVDVSNSFAAILAANTTESRDFVYTIKDTDPDTLVNTVTVHGKPVGTVGIDVTDSASASVEVVALNSIYGFVFTDADGDGVQDAGEEGIEGVQVSLSGAASLSEGTSASGFYRFDNLIPGAYTVNETNPVGYISTTPDGIELVVVSSSFSEANFGDRLPDDSGSVYGTVFDDFDFDGVHDRGETGIPGVTITVDGLPPKTTDSNGGFTFRLTSGNYTISRTNLHDYCSTTVDTVQVEIVPGGEHPVDFGDIYIGGSSIVYGIVFDDVNGNGAQNRGEAGLGGVSVWLKGYVFAAAAGSRSVNASVDSLALAEAAQGGFVLYQSTTSPSGLYAFFNLSPGIYMVSESNPPSHDNNTTSDNVFLWVTDGMVYRVSFGDFEPDPNVAFVYGTVFNDANNDGVQDPGDFGIPGVTMNLQGSATVTDDYGRYTFQNCTPRTSTPYGA